MKLVRHVWDRVARHVQRRLFPGLHRDFESEDFMRQRCQAEDMGGWPACGEFATLQTKKPDDDSGERRYYCEQHRINRHVWYPDIELEPITED